MGEAKRRAHVQAARMSVQEEYRGVLYFGRDLEGITVELEAEPSYRWPWAQLEQLSEEEVKNVLREGAKTFPGVLQAEAQRVGREILSRDCVCSHRCMESFCLKSQDRGIIAAAIYCQACKVASGAGLR